MNSVNFVNFKEATVLGQVRAATGEEMSVDRSSLYVVNTVCTTK